MKALNHHTLSNVINNSFTNPFKNLVANTFVASLMFAITPNAFATEFSLDPHHTNARFESLHFGTSTNTGGFYNLTGDLKYSRLNPEKSFVSVTIPVETLNTGNAVFDKHLLGADYFNAAKYPNITFTSTKWQLAKDGAVSSVDGKLTLLEQTHPVTLKASNFSCYLSPIKKANVCGGDFETTIKRSQWGMSKHSAIAGMDKVTIKIQVEAVEK